MFKVDNGVALVFLLLTLTYFTPCSSVSILNFEHEIAGWASTTPNYTNLIGFSAVIKLLIFTLIKKVLVLKTGKHKFGANLHYIDSVFSDSFWSLILISETQDKTIRIF